MELPRLLGCGPSWDPSKCRQQKALPAPAMCDCKICSEQHLNRRCRKQRASASELLEFLESNAISICPMLSPIKLVLPAAAEASPSRDSLTTRELCFLPAEIRNKCRVHSKIASCSMHLGLSWSLHRSHNEPSLLHLQPSHPWLQRRDPPTPKEPRSFKPKGNATRSLRMPPKS